MYLICFINLYEFLEVCGGQETLVDMSGASWSYAIQSFLIAIYNHMSKHLLSVTIGLQNQLPEVLTTSMRIEIYPQDANKHRSQNIKIRRATGPRRVRS